MLQDDDEGSDRNDPESEDEEVEQPAMSQENYHCQSAMLYCW